MPAGWVAAGAAVLGAASSYAGAKKQSDAAKRGSNLQMDQFRTLNAQQQPYIQSGYGAMGKLNTLLGLGSRPSQSGVSPLPVPSANPAYRPTPGGGVQPIVQMGPQNPMVSGPKMDPRIGMAPQNARLRQLLALRAANGDTEAARMLGAV